MAGPTLHYWCKPFSSLTLAHPYKEGAVPSTKAHSPAKTVCSQPNRRATSVAAGLPQIRKVALVSHFPARSPGSHILAFNAIQHCSPLGKQELYRREDEATSEASSALDGLTHSEALLPVFLCSPRDSGYSLLCPDVQVKWQPCWGEVMGCSPD